MSIFQGAERVSAPAPMRETASVAVTPDLTSLTNAQLAALCDERGIDVPRKATKAQLLALLAD